MTKQPIIRYLTPAEKAANLGISVRTLASLVKQKRIPEPERLGRCVRFPLRADEVTPS